MNTLESIPQESDQSNSYVFMGGGSTGNTAAGFMDAVEAGMIEGVKNVTVKAIVTTGDSGGATGRGRKATGTVATGDLRRTHSALSSNEYVAAEFEGRYLAESTPETVEAHTRQFMASYSYGIPSRLGDERITEIMDGAVSLAKYIYENDAEKLKGYALGHLVLTSIALEKGMDEASQEVGELLAGRAEVIPVATDWHNLMMIDGDETPIYGEHEIDTYEIKHPDNVTVSLYTEEDHTSKGVPLNPRAEAAIDNAHKVIVGPGSVYTSMVPNLLVDGMPEALARMKAEDRKLILIGNLTTQSTETAGWSFKRYVEETEKYAQRRFDGLIVNDDTEGIDNAVMFDRNELAQHGGEYRVIATKMVKAEKPTYDAGDLLAAAGLRSDVAHDMNAVTMALFNIEAATMLNEELAKA